MNGREREIENRAAVGEAERILERVEELVVLLCLWIGRVGVEGRLVLLLLPNSENAFRRLQRFFFSFSNLCCSITGGT